MKSIELFAGAGGLCIGSHLAGFKPVAVIEWDKWACDTLRENQELGHPAVSDFPVIKADVREFDFSAINEKVQLLSGGPPCQPFSLGGKHNAYLDERDMFPPTIAAIRALQPDAFIIENVKGLTRKTFSTYFQYIVLQLEFPYVIAKAGEPWTEHLRRLEEAKTSAHVNPPTYEVLPRVLNAANYGIPQRRERIFFVGFKHKLGLSWSFPEATHSLDRLQYEKWVSKEYWDRNEISKSHREPAPQKLSRKLPQLSESPPDSKPWKTVREGLKGLPTPGSKQSRDFLDHDFQPGARTYPGHTGSPIDEPAKTLKAGVHGVPGGENMIRFHDGKVRYFSIREAARLQTFPDDYRFHGSWTEIMRQLGNAVPVELARIVSDSVARKLASVEVPSVDDRGYDRD